MGKLLKNLDEEASFNSYEKLVLKKLEVIVRFFSSFFLQSVYRKFIHIVLY